MCTFQQITPLSFAFDLLCVGQSPGDRLWSLRGSAWGMTACRGRFTCFLYYMPIASIAHTFGSCFFFFFSFQLKEWWILFRKQLWGLTDQWFRVEPEIVFKELPMTVLITLVYNSKDLVTLLQDKFNSNMNYIYIYEFKGWEPWCVELCYYSSYYLGCHLINSHILFWKITLKKCI